MKYKKVLIPIILIIIILIGIIIYASNNLGNNYYYTLPQPDPGLIFVKLLDVSDNKIRKVTNKKFEKIYRMNIYFYNVKELIYWEKDAIELFNKNYMLSYYTLLRSLFMDYKNDYGSISTYQKFLEYEKYTYEDYVVIICNTRAGNNNMYIGTPDLTFEDVYNVGEV